MAKYRLAGSGVQDVELKHFIPFDTSNRHFKQYLKWLGEGNTPDPEYTQEQLDQLDALKEVISLRSDLTKAIAWQFRMILEMFQVGKAKGLWANDDFSPEVQAKAAEWKAKTDRLLQLGE